MRIEPHMIHLNLWERINPKPGDDFSAKFLLYSDFNDAKIMIKASRVAMIDLPLLQKAAGMRLTGGSAQGLPVLLWILILFVAWLVCKGIVGKIRSADGKEQIQGIPAILQSISNLFNDKVDRDVKRAQIARSDAERKRIEAETEKIKADAQRQSIENSRNMLHLADGSREKRETERRASPQSPVQGREAEKAQDPKE